MSERAPRPISNILHDKLDGFVAGIASKRNSALIRDEAQGDAERERELRAENEDAITSLPQAKHLQPYVLPPTVQMRFPPPPKSPKSVARENSLKKLEGKEKRQSMLSSISGMDGHEATRRFLSPSSASSTHSRGREFHFPPSPRHDVPHFQFAPPSPRKAYNPQNFPPPPPGPPPQGGYRPASFIGQDSPQAPKSFQQSDFPIPPSTYTPSTYSDSKHPEDPKDPEPALPARAHTKGKSADLHINIPPAPETQPQTSTFDFGFPSTPTEFQKNLMRFAFVGAKKKEGWSTEYGRPDLGYMLKEMATGGADGKGIFGRRTCVFVCGPPSMRVDVANTVARLQADIWGDDSKDEIFLHTENYAI
jgi:hypothetical protein